MLQPPRTLKAYILGVVRPLVTAISQTQRVVAGRLDAMNVLKADKTTTDALTASVNALDATKADKTTTLTGTGLVTGGGDLSADRTLTLIDVAQNTVLGRTSAGAGAPGVVSAPMVGVITAADQAAARGALGLGSAATEDTATSSTPDTVVARDGSGNFAAGTITATLAGNASTASALQTGRTIALSGAATGTATLFDGSANITIPVTGLDASLLSSGTIPLARLPAGALERLVPVANQAARFALTSAQVQEGDTVRELDSGQLYVVVDTANLGNAAGYVNYTAGIASAVPWSGVQNTPTTAGGYGITDVYTKTEVNTALGLKANLSGAAFTGDISTTGDVLVGSSGTVLGNTSLNIGDAVPTARYQLATGAYHLTVKRWDGAAFVEKYRFDADGELYIGGQKVYHTGNFSSTTLVAGDSSLALSDAGSDATANLAIDAKNLLKLGSVYTISALSRTTQSADHVTNHNQLGFYNPSGGILIYGARSDTSVDGFAGPVGLMAGMAAAGSGKGGSNAILSGGGGDGSGSGGNALIFGGTAGVTGNAGNIVITGQAGGTTSGNGGSVTISSGVATSGTPGTITLNSAGALALAGTTSITLNGADVQIGNASSVVNGLRYLNVYNTDTGASAGAVLRLISSNAAGDGVANLDIVKYKTGGVVYNNTQSGATHQFQIAGSAILTLGPSGSGIATNLEVYKAQPYLVLHATDGGTDAKRYIIRSFASGGTTYVDHSCSTDTGAAEQQAWRLTRTGNAWDTQTWYIGGAQKLKLTSAGVEIAAPTFTGAVLASSASEIRLPGTGSTGSSHIYPGNGDGASYTTHNLLLKLWWGLGISDHSNTVNGYYDARAGVWDVKGGYKINGVSIFQNPIFTGTSFGLSGAAGTYRGFNFLTNDAGTNKLRFGFGIDQVAEAGGNAGSNFAMHYYTDSGAYGGGVFSVTRSNGIFSFFQSPTAPTPTAGDNTTKLATTAFVTAAVAAGGGGTSLSSGGNSVTLSGSSGANNGIISMTTNSGATINLGNRHHLSANSDTAGVSATTASLSTAQLYNPVGSIRLQGARSDTSATGTAGAVSMFGGSGAAGSNAGGGTGQFFGGQGDGTGAGGMFSVGGGNGGSNGAGGVLNLVGGNAGGGNNPGGDINITGGTNAGSGRFGFINIKGGVTEGFVARTNTGSAVTLSVLSLQLYTVNANTTLTLPTVTLNSNTEINITVNLKMDGTGGYTVSWAAPAGQTIEWDDNTAPILNTGANEVNKVTFTRTEGETVWRGSLSWKR